MTEQLISLETAKLAKEKGFNWECDKGYYKRENPNNLEPLLLWVDAEQTYPEFGFAPTQSLLQKWLREVHKIHIEIDTVWNEELTEIIGFHSFVYKTWSEKVEITMSNVKNGINSLPTYEEALEEGLLEALKLIN